MVFGFGDLILQQYGCLLSQCGGSMFIQASREERVATDITAGTRSASIGKTMADKIKAATAG